MLLVFCTLFTNGLIRRGGSNGLGGNLRDRVRIQFLLRYFDPLSPGSTILPILLGSRIRTIIWSSSRTSLSIMRAVYFERTEQYCTHKDQRLVNLPKSVTVILDTRDAYSFRLQLRYVTTAKLTKRCGVAGGYARPLYY